MSRFPRHPFPGPSLALLVTWVAIARLASAEAGDPPVCGQQGSCRTGEVSLPEGLRARAPAPELSGLAWAPSLGRYLAVVDEPLLIGEAGGRAAVVLALDSAGALDPDPVPIIGLEAGEVDDAEALAPGRPGTFFLLTSHAPTRRGKLARGRRQLLELVLEGRRLRVTGSVDLLAGKGSVGRLLEELGFSRATAVDFEGLAYRDGALYLGLKSPVSREGAAMVFRIEDPGAAFAHDKVKKGTLALWGEVKLSGQAPSGEVVPQGIADLAFGPDGTLYVCANAPKDGTADGGGTLWQVGQPKGGRMEARLLRRFPGLKPEGVAIAPGGRALALVFDRDAGPPHWTTWPLPALDVTSPFRGRGGGRPLVDQPSQSNGPVGGAGD